MNNASPKQPSSPLIRVLVVDDHRVVREGLACVLADEQDMEIIAEARDGHEACALAMKLQPDVVLMDVSMPRLNGRDATRRILREVPLVRVIGLSMHSEGDMEQEMLEAGACMYLCKDGPVEALIAAIRTCAQVPDGA